MKKTVVLLLLVLTTQGYSQFAKSMFSKDPIINLENWQKQRLYFGYYLGFNSFDFKFDYKDVVTEDIQVKKTTGFNVGVVADLRLQEYINLRFEPGLYYTKRDLYYPNFESKNDFFREVNSTYIHFPLLLKFSSLRTGNIRPFLVGGLSTTLNLSSNSKSKDDNFQQKFRVKSWTNAYELGFGIDLFSEYFIFSPSIRGVFGIGDELIRDNVTAENPNSPWTGNIDSMKSRAILINFTFH
ncbi:MULTISPECIES: type IX secretion/gliding motility protein PorT/SprT [Flavobacterium]|uniref:PorT family protein n=2 Tax=Flavobacterium TaxID=237 RepID=A0A940XBR3_9FLAO|nr:MULTISPECIES: porin family protein [Flavobacterium]MBP4139086.1 PorT family protein [Flavobacterium geliluteum]MDX6181352.1 porin family protein [Flavobacterium sp. Fl-33]MDX6184953.1 porin family protein [Flavobacterium sp. Fl-77]UFH40045.1 PorT family protein [Flavobacterium sp. F-70]